MGSFVKVPGCQRGCRGTGIRRNVKRAFFGVGSGTGYISNTLKNAHALSILGFHPRKITRDVPKDEWARIFIAALFIILNNWKQTGSGNWAGRVMHPMPSNFHKYTDMLNKIQLEYEIHQLAREKRPFPGSEGNYIQI